MTCEPFDEVIDGKRITGMICTPTPRVRCAFCSAWSVRLCDGPPRQGSRKKTCDAPLCAKHATAGDAPNTDFCPQHAGDAMRRGAPARPIGDLFTTSQTLARARDVAARFRRPTAEGDAPCDAGGNAAHPPTPEPAAPLVRPPPAPDPAPNSPEDVGYTDAARAPPPARPAAPSHIPKTCSACPAPIFWAQLIDPSGELALNDEGRMKSAPIDALPSPNGNIVIADRNGSIVYRVLPKDELEAARARGAKLRTNHFVTCPAAPHFRKKKAPR